MRSDGPVLNRLFLPHHHEILKFLLHHDTFQRTCETINTAVLIGLEKRSLLNPDWHFCAGSVLKETTHTVGGGPIFKASICCVFFVVTELIPLQPVESLSAGLGNVIACQADDEGALSLCDYI